MKYSYFKGGPDRRETVEIETDDDMYGVTTCVIDIQLLICGIKTFPCGSGADYRLTSERRLEILEAVQKERMLYTEVEVKTAEGWHNSGISYFEDYCKPGDLVDEAIVEHFVNSVPPHLMRSACTQAGEPYSTAKHPETGKYGNLWTTFHRVDDGLWRFDGECFSGENIDRAGDTSSLSRAIAEARKEVAMDNALFYEVYNDNERFC